MDVDEQQSKPLRILSIYERLRRGEVISKKMRQNDLTSTKKPFNVILMSCVHTLLTRFTIL